MITRFDVIVIIRNRNQTTWAIRLGLENEDKVGLVRKGGDVDWLAAQRVFLAFSFSSFLNPFSVVNLHHCDDPYRIAHMWRCLSLLLDSRYYRLYQFFFSEQEILARKTARSKVS